MEEEERRRVYTAWKTEVDEDAGGVS